MFKVGDKVRLKKLAELDNSVLTEMNKDDQNEYDVKFSNKEFTISNVINTKKNTFYELLEDDDIVMTDLQKYLWEKIFNRSIPNKNHVFTDKFFTNQLV